MVDLEDTEKLLVSSIESIYGVDLTKNDRLVLLYDQACPLCSQLALRYGIEKHFGPVVLLDARKQPCVAEVCKRAGFDLNEGVLVSHAGNLFFGHQALSYLNQVGSLQGWVGSIMAIFLRRPVFSRIAYPLLKTMRSVLLKITGIPKL